MIVYIVFHIACAIFSSWLAIKTLDRLTLGFLVVNIVTGPIGALVALFATWEDVVVYRKKERTK